MLRFLSRRNRNHQNINTNNSDIKSHRIPTNKNLIQCRVILLDNSDISIELSVSRLITLCEKRIEKCTVCVPLLNFLIGLKYSKVSSIGQLAHRELCSTNKRIKRKFSCFFHSLTEICGKSIYIQARSQS